MTGALPVRVMIVDDSAIIRGMMSRALAENPEIQIVASVVNGKAALNTINVQPVDIVLLDVEMPEMDGITALPILLQKSPRSQVIMVSNLTQKDADFTMKALQLGASDCIAKPSTQHDKNSANAFFKEVEKKVITLAREGRPSQAITVTTTVPTSAKSQKPAAVTASSGTASTTAQSPSQPVKCLAFGASTGGPQALMQIFRALRGHPIRVPILITQHMPATFTKIFANHIKEASALPCVEAVDGQELAPGCIYIAPGDYHLVPYAKDGKVFAGVNQGAPVNFCRPSVDPMLQALAEIYGAGLLAIILTGMGQDGLKGCRTIAGKKGRIIVQDQASSIVWGMPKAVAEAGLAKAVAPLGQIADLIRKELR